MSEMGTAAAPAGGANGADVKPSDDNQSRGLLDDLDSDRVPTPPQTWPENWKELVAGDDAAFAKQLARMSDPKELGKAYREIVKQRNAKPIAPSLPDEPTEDDIAAYRKAVGIPDKPDGYGVKFSDEFGATEADNAVLQEFLAEMHAAHATPAEAKRALGWYEKRALKIQEQRAEAEAAAARETTTQLRAEYGIADARKNLGITDAFMEKWGLGWVLDQPHPVTGLPARYTPDAIKSLISMVLNHADEDAVYAGDTGGGGKGLDERISELRAKSAMNKITKAEDAELDDLYKRRLKRDGIAA
jgi:hypothetical protein